MGMGMEMGEGEGEGWGRGGGDPCGPTSSHVPLANFHPSFLRDGWGKGRWKELQGTPSMNPVGSDSKAAIIRM